MVDQRNVDTGPGMYFAPYRYYSPGIALWLTQDPLGMADRTNLYAYVGGNPIVFYDLYGLSFWDFIQPAQWNPLSCLGEWIYHGFGSNRILGALGLTGTTMAATGASIQATEAVSKRPPARVGGFRVGRSLTAGGTALILIGNEATMATIDKTANNLARTLAPGIKRSHTPSHHIKLYKWEEGPDALPSVGRVAAPPAQKSWYHYCL